MPAKFRNVGFWIGGDEDTINIITDSKIRRCGLVHVDVWVLKQVRIPLTSGTRSSKLHNRRHWYVCGFISIVKIKFEFPYTYSIASSKENFAVYYIVNIPVFWLRTRMNDLFSVALSSMWSASTVWRCAMSDSFISRVGLETKSPTRSVSLLSRRCLV